MFSTCQTISSLNETRIALIRNGADSATVNRAYNKRKQELLSGSANNFKRVQFIPVTVNNPKTYRGDFGIRLGEDNYTLYVDYE